MARSKSIHGPYESNPANPVLSNANTNEYFQAVGHADLFQDASGNWWGVALSVRSGPSYLHFPMVRETVMVPVTWSTREFPVWSPVRGEMSGWPFPPENTDAKGPGVNLDFHPSSLEEEAGVSVFLTQNHHLDLGVVMLPSNSSTATLPNTGNGIVRQSGTLAPHLRFRGESYVPVPDDIIAPLPEAWLGRTLRLEVRASNMTHYSLSAGPADAMSETMTILDVSNEPVSWGFTGVYCTTNGRNGTGTPAYFSKWRYTPQGQYRN
ncbi:hypothetical protein DL771_004475 [Monosporascus sp. 5C6A]|nr:hypothetical protein DL771_004475 [Monosporascus sp. 5C6A]